MFDSQTDAAPPPRAGGLPARLRKVPWALADQVLISATNFITIILLARGIQPVAFGEFTLIYSALLFVNSIQAGIITQPHNILGVTYRGREYQVYTTSTAVSQLLLAGGSALVALAAWAGALLCGWSLAPLFLALAPTIFAWQFQELFRRFLYTEGREGAATLNDVLGYGGQILAIAALQVTGRLTCVSALYAICVSSTAGAIYGLWQVRASLGRTVDRGLILKNWHFGKWIAGGEIVGYWLSAQLFVFLAAGMLGASAAAILRAAHTVFGPCRVLADLLCTVLPIRFARTFAARGGTGLHAQVLFSYAVSVPILGGYCLGVVFFAKPLLRLLYDDRYAGSAGVLAGYALAAFASYMMMIIAAALRARRLTRELFFGQLYASLISLPIGWVMIRTAGINGTVMGMFATYLAMILLFCFAYRRAGKTAAPAAVEPAQGEAAAASAALLRRVFALLDHAGVPYCVTHGYETFPDAIRSDVDLVMPAAFVRRELAPLLAGNRAALGADVVQWVREGTNYVVLMGRGEGGAIGHVCLDITPGCVLGGRLFLGDAEMLAGRRRRGCFWVPAAETEFTARLLRRVYKGNLNEQEAAGLSALYRGCAPEAETRVRRFFGRPDAEQLIDAASSGDWAAPLARLARLRGRLLRRATVRQPLGVAARSLARTARRVGRWCRPGCGLHVVFLGPDGAGKSSVVRAVREDLAPAFFATSARSFPPALLHRGDPNAITRPHELPPRSAVASALRAVGYWWVYHAPGHLLTVRADAARGRLVLHDRHLIDALVDPKRYRYGGPMGLLRLVARLIPRPDLAVVLDAPPEVIQSRKQEVPLAETARQCAAYRELAARLPAARTVDANRGLGQCVADVEDAILDCMAARVRRRLGLAAEAERGGAVAAVLKESGDPTRRWFVRPAGSGDQAHIYKAAPADGSGGECVVKLFRADRPEVAMTLEEEFQSLARLHSALDRVSVDGWRLATPAPLHRCAGRLALVMTAVPGRPMGELLAGGGLGADADAVVRVLAAALHRYWESGGRIYGDFNLDNVLCDPAGRCISLVDPGMPERLFACPGVARRWDPASRDLAYILFDTATSIRSTLLKPALRRHQWELVGGLLSATMARLGSAEACASFLAEVEACCRVHLGRIRTSWSAKGLRHLMVRQAARVRIDRVLARLAEGVSREEVSQWREAA